MGATTDDSQPAPTLSQTLTTISGAVYAGSLYVQNGAAGPPGHVADPKAFFDVLVDGLNVVSLTGAAGGYTLYTFAFTGTGSDTLDLTGNTAVSSWYVDDVAVTCANPAAVGGCSGGGWVDTRSGTCHARASRPRPGGTRFLAPQAVTEARAAHCIIDQSIQASFGAWNHDR
jgi:hypothetical protein